MDVQNGIVRRLGDHIGPYLETVNRAIRAAHADSMTVCFVRVAFRHGAPEAAQRNPNFAALAGAFGIDDEATQLPEALDHGPDDIVIVKKRVSAFTGSDIDVVLRAAGATNLILCGIATSGVVLSTLRQAADLDFEVTVLRDACFDQDPEVHRVLTEKVFVRQARVVTTDEWIDSLREQ